MKILIGKLLKEEVEDILDMRGKWLNHTNLEVTVFLWKMKTNIGAYIKKLHDVFLLGSYTVIGALVSMYNSHL